MTPLRLPNISRKRSKRLINSLDSRDDLRQSEIRYHRLFGAVHDGVLILDSVSRKIIDANPFMDHLLGYPREELLGKEL
jgi:PAS domain-containing protein